tara:strand:- start:1127 stop:1420 length:294 start_codon:yes stop_codon:yes gene_type:complete
MNLNLSNFEPVNYLWTDLIKRLGFEKAELVIRQAIDVQNMRGERELLPILFVETGGIAFTTYEFLRQETGLSLSEYNKVLLYSLKGKAFQVLHETRK